MSAERRRELIDRYQQGYDEVPRALEGFPADALSARPIPGKWSAREIWLEIYAVHAHDHAGQIRRLREALGR